MKDEDPHLETCLHTLIATGGESPRKRRSATAVQLSAELKQVAEQAGALRSTLDALHTPAASVFLRLDEFKRQLRTIEIIAQSHANRPPSGPEPNRISSAQRLAESAAFVFATITGQEPGRTVADGVAGGPFLFFLGEVFAARGVRASVENSAKKGLQLMELSRTKAAR